MNGDVPFPFQAKQTKSILDPVIVVGQSNPLDVGIDATLQQQVSHPIWMVDSPSIQQQLGVVACSSLLWTGKL